MSDMATELKPRKITVAEYHRMGEAGILRSDERVELLDGAIYEMSPLGWEHGLVHARIVSYLIRRLEKRASVFGMASVALGDFHEPQPDIIIADRRFQVLYERPELHDMFAFIEVADSSLRTDLRLKRGLYASYEIKDYLVVDVKGRALHRFSAPSEGRFVSSERLSYGDAFALTKIPDVMLDVDAFLPPKDRDNL